MKLTTLITFSDLNNIDFSVKKKEGRRGRPPLDPKSMVRTFIGMTGTIPHKSDSPSNG